MNIIGKSGGVITSQQDTPQKTQLPAAENQ